MPRGGKRPNAGRRRGSKGKATIEKAIIAERDLAEAKREQPASHFHLDIAGPARAAETEHYVLKGGTGFGVRTLVALADAMSGI